MANVTFNRCEKTELDNTPITDGMLSFCTDEETIYMDTTTDRKKYGGNASFVELTQEQYDALSYDEKHNGNGYLVEIEGDQWTANNIQYTETQSVKSAIDEIKSGGVDKKVTQAQYDALSEEEKKNGTTYYIETETDQWNADNIKYDNDNSVKDVIDDLNDTTNSLEETVKQLNPIFRSAKISGTTTVNGYLQTTLSAKNKFVVSAVLTGGDGWVVLPVNVSGQWWFYICGTSNNNTVPYMNQGASVTYMYCDIGVLS